MPDWSQELLKQPAFWIALFALVGNFLTIIKARHDRQAADLQARYQSRNQISEADWQKIRQQWEDARVEAREAKVEADQLRSEVDTLRDRQQENISNNWQLRVENEAMRRQIEELQREIADLRARLLQHEGKG